MKATLHVSFAGSGSCFGWNAEIVDHHNYLLFEIVLTRTVINEGSGHATAIYDPSAVSHECVCVVQLWRKLLAHNSRQGCNHRHGCLLDVT
jgi:hypothetical protein